MKQCKHMKKFDEMLNPLRALADKVGSPLWDLTARVYLGYTFFKSGMLRFKDFLNGTFDSQIYLFTDIHPVPGVSPTLAAYGATFGEVILPVLLILGLFGRFAAGGLLVMTGVIHYALGADAIVLESLLWAFLAAALFIKGPGMLSVDHFLLKWLRCEKCESSKSE